MHLRVFCKYDEQELWYLIVYHEFLLHRNQGDSNRPCHLPCEDAAQGVQCISILEIVLMGQDLSLPQLAPCTGERLTM